MSICNERGCEDIQDRVEGALIKDRGMESSFGMGGEDLTQQTNQIKEEKKDSP